MSHCVRLRTGGLTVLAWLVLIAPAIGETPEEEFAKLEKAFTAKLSEFFEQVKQIEDPAKKAELYKEMQPEESKFAAYAWEFANKHAGKDIAVDALQAVFVYGRSPEKPTEESLRNKALAILQRDHLKSPKLANLVLSLAYTRGEAEQHFLREVIDKSPHAEIRGLGVYAKARGLMNQARASIFYKQNTEAQERLSKTPTGKEALEKYLAFDIDKAEKETAELFQILRKEYAEVKEFPPQEGGKRKPRTLGQVADQYLFELSFLKPGSKAPELTSVDFEGKKVRLSDYRGKIVVLDIWATWCAPCVAMIPHQRELVSRLEGKPFVLISISVDEEKETVEKFHKKKPMPWVHWFNGHEGGVLDSWNVNSFPTIYVIDSNGIIRAKNIREKELDKKVDELLEEMATKTESR